MPISSILLSRLSSDKFAPIITFYSYKIVVFRCHKTRFIDSKYQIYSVCYCCRSSAPNHAEEPYSSLPDSLAGFREGASRHSKKRKKREGDNKEKKKGQDVEREEKKEKGRKVVLKGKERRLGPFLANS